MAKPSKSSPSVFSKALNLLFESDSRTRRPRTRQQPPFLQFQSLENRTMLAALSVTTPLDVVNGDTSSILALVASSGDDGISLR